MAELQSKAPTKHDIFERFKAAHSSVSWRDYWADSWAMQLDLYFERGWKVIPIMAKSKRPSEKGWNGKFLDRRRADDWVRSGGNLAVVAGPSNLVVLDIDTQELGDDSILAGVLNMVTPKGYQIFTEAPLDTRLLTQLNQKYPGLLDTVRNGIMYALLPNSETCRRFAAKGCPPDCARLGHDWRVRQWLDPQVPTISFKDLAEALLS